MPWRSCDATLMIALGGSYARRGTPICLLRTQEYMYFINMAMILLYPRSNEGGMGVYWIHPNVRSSVCSSVRPSVCRQDFRNFFKKLLAQFISYLAFTLMGWVSWTLFIFVFLVSFSALWWPNIWPKMGFPDLKKSIGPIHFIPCIYPYGVSLLTPIHFRVNSFIFDPLVANGVSGTLPFFPELYLFVFLV